MWSDQQNLSTFAVTTAISLAVYLQTVAPTIVGGDAGELVAEGCALGTAHPPGYPLFTVLVYLVTRLGQKLNPDVVPAYWVNVLNAVFGGVTSGIISSCSLQLTRIYVDVGESGRQSRIKRKIAPIAKDSRLFTDTCAAVLSGLLNTFSPLQWQYATTAEVFALHNLFVTLIIHTAIRFSKKKTKGLLLFGAFLCGLALTNQHTSILLELPVIIWVFHAADLRHNSAMLSKAGVAFLVPLSFYCTMPYLAATKPHAGSWGDVTSFRGFFHHFLRKDYGTLRLYSGNQQGTESMVARTFQWFLDFTTRQAGSPVTLIFFACGFFTLTGIQITGGRKFAIGRVLVASLIFYLVVFHSLSNLPLSEPLLYGIHQVGQVRLFLIQVMNFLYQLVAKLTHHTTLTFAHFLLQRFWLHPNALAFICIGVGAAILNRKLVGSSRTGNITFSTAFLVLAIYSFRKNIDGSDQSDNFIFRNYALSVLESLPPEALIFINYDQQWTSVRYFQECEGIRKDVTSINLSMMSYIWW